MKTHGCPHINSCSSCLLPSAFLVSLSILFLLYLPPHPSTLSFSTSSHTNSLTMTSSDVSSVYSPATAEETHQRVNETDLSLCLSLSSSANMGLNSGKGCSRVFGNESVKESAESREMGNGGWFKGRMKRVNSETIGGEEQRKRRVFSLQLREPSCEQVQLQGSIHSSPRSPAVGWPPLQTCRKNAVYTQQRSPPRENVEETTSGNSVECKRGSNFVKVVMDGMAIGRKVDLNAHDSYSSLALTLENMFQLPPILKDEHSSSTHWRLLDCASDYLLTYVDKDGDWMLLGDAPWENFVKSVKRLRISHSTINGSSSQLVGAKDTKKMNYITRHFVDFVNAQRL